MSSTPKPSTPKKKNSARKASGSATPKGSARKAVDAPPAGASGLTTDEQEAEDGAKRLAEVMSSFRNMPAAEPEDRVGRLPDTIKTPSIVLQHSSKVNAMPADGTAPAAEDPDDVIGRGPISRRAGKHDITEDNWAQRSQRAAALARENEMANLDAKRARSFQPLLPVKARARMHAMCMTNDARVAPSSVASALGDALARGEGARRERAYCSVLNTS